jgi:hypothetical protein
LVPQIDPRHPRPRRTLQQQHVRPAIFADNQFGTSNTGLIAFDAKWSKYGEYLQRMMEEIQISFDKVLDQSRIYPSPGTLVTVTFHLNSKGEITGSISHKSDLEGPHVDACMSALTLPAPYGPWSDDMIALLGNEQEMTIGFYYE